MAKFNPQIITYAGYQMITQAIGEHKLTFTHAITSSTDISRSTKDEIRAMTSLTNNQQDLPLGMISTDDTNKVNIPVKITNVDSKGNALVTSDYQMYALGLYAKVDDQPEQLYSVVAATDPELITAYDGKSMMSVTLTLNTHVSSTDNVIIQVTPDGSVSMEDLEAALSKYVLKDDFDKLIAEKLPSTLTDSTKDETITGKWDFSNLTLGGKAVVTSDNLPSNLLTTDTTNNWQKYKVTSDDGKAINYTGDVNDLKTAGQYFVKNPSHVPDSGAWWFVDVKVSPDAGTSVIQQSGHGDNYDMFWERTCRNGVWSAWAKRISGVDLENRLTTFAQTITDSIMAKIVDPNTGQAKIKMNFNYGDLTVDTDPVVPIVKVADEASATTREATHPNTQHEWGES